jgi:DinB superfamily
VAGMTKVEREFVVGQLRESAARLAEAVGGLTRAQADYRETLERWSIAEVVEHLVVWESFMLGTVRGSLDRPAEPGKQAAVAGKDHLVLGLASSRNTPLKAREAAQPTGRWSDGSEMLAEFRSRRAATIELAETTQADLRCHFFAHITFGDLDCYQWLVAMGQHTLRHVAQIGEIVRNPAFPKT